MRGVATRNINGGVYVKVGDEMVWPGVGLRQARRDWEMRYSSPSKASAAYAASVLSAYRDLVCMPARERNRVVAALRRAARSEDSIGEAES